MIFLFILLLSNSNSLMKYNFIMSVRNLIIISNTPEIYNIASKQIIGSCNKLSLEHIFPKSYMNKKCGASNDLHNIFKCNNYILYFIIISSNSCLEYFLIPYLESSSNCIIFFSPYFFINPCL